jgi:hypothetical protein
MHYRRNNNRQSYEDREAQVISRGFQHKSTKVLYTDRRQEIVVATNANVPNDKSKHQTPTQSEGMKYLQ